MLRHDDPHPQMPYSVGLPYDEGLTHETVRFVIYKESCKSCAWLILYLHRGLRMGKLIDLTGQTFGRLIVVKRVENNKHKQSQWLCQCSCRQSIVVRCCDLKSDNTQSCGCLRTEIITKHGHGCLKKRSKSYKAWLHMIQRCTNLNDSSYKHYGGRGIKVCEAWRKFENFLEDMGERPKNMTLDRVDNDGNYCPENCRWATRSEQQRNRRNTIFITIYGVTQPLAEWCETYNSNYNMVYGRIYRCGWTPEEALEIIPRRKKMLIK